MPPTSPVVAGPQASDEIDAGRQHAGPLHRRPSDRARRLAAHLPTPATLLRLGGFVLLASVLTLPDLGHLNSRVAGDGGDAFFNLYVLEWGAHALRHGLSHYWAGTIFLGAHLPMAYSDTHLGVVPLY